MLTDPSKIIKALVAIIDNNREVIDKKVDYWFTGQVLHVFEGKRNHLPADCFPFMDIDPAGSTSEWIATRLQMGTYNFSCRIGASSDFFEGNLHCITDLTTIMTSMLCDPKNLQFVIDNPSWEFYGGQKEHTTVLDSFVSDANYQSGQNGTIRISEFSWMVKIVEPYPDSHFRTFDGFGNVIQGDGSQPKAFERIVDPY